jgi:fumarate hydratase subunit alpha
VLHPITRVNTGDNTPGVIHTEIVPGDGFKITLAPKGFGSENMSRVMMFPPSAGIEGVKDFIVQRVEESGGNPLPVVVGVGLGGTFEKAARQLHCLPARHPKPRLGFGQSKRNFSNGSTGWDRSMGLGGRTTVAGM